MASCSSKAPSPGAAASESALPRERASEVLSQRRAAATQAPLPPAAGRFVEGSIVRISMENFQ